MPLVAAALFFGALAAGCVDAEPTGGPAEAEADADARAVQDSDAANAAVLTLTDFPQQGALEAISWQRLPTAEQARLDRRRAVVADCVGADPSKLYPGAVVESPTFMEEFGQGHLRSIVIVAADDDEAEAAFALLDDPAVNRCLHRFFPHADTKPYTPERVNERRSSEVDAPELGDEAAVMRTTLQADDLPPEFSTFHHDTVVVRVGRALVILLAYDRGTPLPTDQLHQHAETVMNRLQASLHP